jgi:hypothetical protein
MNAAPTARDRWIWLASAGLMGFTLGLELVVPLGYAVWLTYFMAVGITLFQRRLEVPVLVAVGSCVLLAVGYHVAPASTNSAFSFVNRSIGGVCFLLMALTVVKAIQARRTAADALWLQEGENAVTVSLRGDPEPRTLANEAMRTLCAQLNADVGALYRLHGERLVLVGGAALPSNLPESLPTAAGQWGEVVRLGAPRRLEEGDSVLQIETALGRTRTAGGNPAPGRGTAGPAGRAARQQRRAGRAGPRAEGIAGPAGIAADRAGADQLAARGADAAAGAQRDELARAGRAGGQGRRAGTRQPVQERIPGQHEPRAAHAAELHADPGQAAGRQQGRQPHRGTGQVRADHLRQPATTC